MNVLSLFSGVGGFDLGLEAAGMRTVGLCEIDKNCRRVLRRHWPDTPIYEDVSTLTASQLIADGVLPDVVAFGSPCQDLSVAGKRAGLAGSRSGLFGEALRIIRELKAETHGTYPTWAIWENVTGALNSTSGRDFAAVLDAMADAGAMALEWAVLDAQNFGVPQRRRRVFLVACFDPRAGEFCPDPLLPVGEGSPRDLAARRTAWKESARAAEGRAGSGRHEGTIVLDRASFNQGANAAYEPRIEESDTVPTLVARGPHAVAYPTHDVVGTLSPGAHPGGVNGQDAYSGQLIPVLMRQREGKPGGGKGPLLSDVSLTLATSNDQTLFQPTLEDATKFEAVETYVKAKRASSVDDYDRWEQTDTAPTLNAFDIGDTRTVTAVVEPIPIHDQATRWSGLNGDKVVGKGNGLGIGEPGDPMNTLTQGDRHAVAQPVIEVDPVGTIEARYYKGPNHENARDGHLLSTTDLAVRRLTPLECERLMGWPDDHTRWADDGTEMKDSHRYKMCGNGIASPVAEWIGRHVLLAQAYLEAVPE